jgi:class 3 adenylate cyclase/tetratricopeptide (TPR) repeat protein
MAKDGGAGAGRSIAIVLFTDLVGSTELRTRLGEDAAEELRRTHDRLIASAVAAKRGHVVKNLGDGIMATFTGAADAVEAAVAIQHGIGRHNRSSAAALEVRIGVSAGDVVFEGDDCFGTPVIEAARLCGAARGGQILASELVRGLARAGRGTFTPVGSLELKGLPEPIPVVEVGWEPLPQSPVPLPTFLTDIGRIFVGRDGDLDRLGQLWNETAAGELRVALLAGEPGVGKTRLAAELARLVHDDGATVLAGRCDEDLGVPYQPFVEALRTFVGHTPPGDLAARLGRYPGELTRILPELPERLPGVAPPLRSDPETERYRLFDAIIGWLTAAASEQPVLLVLDDLQWAAKPTLLLLRHVVRAPELRRVLVLGTYRDTELGPDHPLVEVLADLRRRDGVERLSLVGFDTGGVAAFMERAAGHALGDDEVALSRAIHGETEGNPFFVREVLRHLRETGAIEEREGRWVTRGPAEELGIPEGVREVVGRRLARLSDAANQVLRVACVIGADFEVVVLGRATDSVDDEALLSTLEEATAARLVRETPGAAGRYRFSHALVRMALYDGLSAPRRMMLHRRVAEAIEAAHGRRLDAYVPALAHHYARAAVSAADTARAVDYAVRAGGLADAQLAHDEAVAYYRQALEFLEAAETTEGPRRLELLLALGEAQRCAGDPEHREILLQAGCLAHEQGDAGGAARAALSNQRGYFSRFGEVDAERVEALEAALGAVGAPESAVRARLLASLAGELYWADDIRRQEFGDEALAIARRLGDPVTLAEVISVVWLATWDPAGARQRARFAEELTELATRLDDPLLKFQAGYARFLTAGELGDIDGVDSGLELCRGVAEQLNQPVLRWRTAVLHANRAIITGRLDEAERLTGEARRLGESTGQPDCGLLHDAALAIVRTFQLRFDDAAALVDPTVKISAWRAAGAWIHAELGRSDEARTLLDELRAADFAEVPRNHNWLAVLTFISRACARLGDSETAAQIYDLLLPNRADVVVQLIVSLGPVAHNLGLLATLLRRYEDAEAHFTEAAGIEAHMRASAMLVHTRLEWTRMLLARSEPGDAERAHALLGQALATARELRLTNIEREAVQLLLSSQGNTRPR